MRETPEVTTGVATVCFYGTRRFLTKRGAVEAKVRDMMRGEAHGQTGDDEPCECFYCADKYGDGERAFKEITRAVMRGEPIPDEYTNALQPEVASRDEHE